MARSWDSLSAEEVAGYVEKVCKVYEQYSDCKWLTPMSVDTENVNILMANQFQKQASAKIEASVPEDQADKAKEITAAFEEALSGVKVEIALQVKLGPGVKMPKLEGLKNLDNTDAVVEHKEGEVWLLDFWATWCPPCQAPMAHNQKMLEEHGGKWGGKVRIIGASIDNDAGTIKNHVESKGWTKVEHYWARSAGCKAPDVFGVEGVPHVLLIDTQGKVAFIGHPASRPDLVKDFDTLLAGGSLDGVAGGDSDGATGGSVSGISDAEAMPAMKKFCEESEQLRKDHGSKFQGLPRAFLVLVDEAKLDVSAKCFKHKMTCHTVIMGGDQAKHDEIKPILEAVNKGPWENKDQYRVM